MSQISDFIVLKKIGKERFNSTHIYLGSGSYSEVFKVSRKSDGKEYALKKVFSLSTKNVRLN